MRILRLSLGVAASTAVAATLAFVALGGTGERGGNAIAATQDKQPSGLPVPVAAVAKKSVPIYLDYVATADAIRSVSLQAKVTGYLLARGAADGDDVKVGDLLYRIDPRDYQAVLDQAKAQAQRDAAQREYAETNAYRNEYLSKKGDVAIAVYQQSASTLHQADAAIAADRAAIEAAQLNVGYAEIRAAFAGRLGRSQVHEGALISAAGTQLNTLVQLDPIYVSFNPPETDLAAIMKAQAEGPVAAKVMIGDDPMPRFSGALTFLDNTVDRTTGTITARATIANPALSLLPGQYARVRLHIGEQPGALLVPQIAVGSGQVGRFVYIVGKDQKAEQRMVTLGRTLGDLVVVEKGVSEGESVIVGNLQKIGPGAAVLPEPAAVGEQPSSSSF
jgi:multidrug efflux system membrane fusion protein